MLLASDALTCTDTSPIRLDTKPRTRPVVLCQGTLSRLDAVLPAVVTLGASGWVDILLVVAGLNSIPDGPLFIRICMVTAFTLLSTALTGFTRAKWSTIGKVISMKLKTHARHAWLASAPLAGFGSWKLVNVAGSG
jgi:hypothetical protein